MKRVFLLALVLATTVFGATVKTYRDDGFIIRVNSDGTFYPEGAAVSVSEMAQIVAQVEASAWQLELAETNSVLLQAAVDEINGILNSLAKIGYIQGEVVSFDGAVEVNTNATCTILKMEQATHSPANTNMTYWALYSYFTAEPDDYPAVRYSRSLTNGTQLWDRAPVVDSSVVLLTHTDGQVYECYKSVVELPKEYSEAFMQVFADVFAPSDLTYFDVENGVSPGGRTPLTLEIDGIKFVGGIRCQ